MRMFGSYDLADPDELCDFVDDFKMMAAENMLKLYLRDGAAMKDCQGRVVGADNYVTCVQLALLVLDSHIRRCEQTHCVSIICITQYLGSFFFWET